MDEFKKEAIRIALREMFRKGSFSICTVDTCLEIANIPIPRDEYETLRALHCIDYSEMPPDFRVQLFQKIIGLFEYPTLEISEFEIFKPKITDKKRLLRNIFN